MITRALFAVLAAAVLAAVPVGAASANTDQVEQFRFVGVDDDFSAELTDLCGIPLTVTVDAHETHLFFEDRGQFIIHYTAVITGGANVIQLAENFVETDTDDSVTWVGVPFHVLDAEGRTLIRDAGYASFAFEDGMVTLHGPHPGFYGFDICGALMG